MQRVRPEVTVVIPARNASRTLVTQLAALERQEFGGPFEVVVVDNGSDDHTFDVAMGWRSSKYHLECIQAPGPASASRARNVGARSARAARLAFCDADDEVEDRWLAAIVAASPSQGIFVGGRVDEIVLNQGNRRRHFDDGDDLPVAWWFLRAAASCNLLMWTSDFASLGGFDESLPYPAEDTDLSWRAQLAGLELRYEPAAVIRYRHRLRGSQAVQQAAKYGVGAACLLDRHRRVAGVPQGAPGDVRAMGIGRELRRSFSSRSAVPFVSQLAYEAAFSWTRRRLIARHRRFAVMAAESSAGSDAH